MGKRDVAEVARILQVGEEAARASIGIRMKRYARLLESRVAGKRRRLSLAEIGEDET